MIRTRLLGKRPRPVERRHGLRDEVCDGHGTAARAYGSTAGGLLPADDEHVVSEASPPEGPRHELAGPFGGLEGHLEAPRPQ